MMELNSDRLCVSFPEVHQDAHCQISFQRTLRIPDDNREYPLPAGLGNFPIFHVDDYAEKVPRTWIDHGGVFLPMYQSEAMWINFQVPDDYPFAVKIAAGKINAVTGESWSDGLSASSQDYVVLPDQPWLDGFSIRHDLIRQFVAMPLGEGFTAEAQISGEEVMGGLQIAVYPMKANYYEKHVSRPSSLQASDFYVSCNVDMGLAPGGLMRQEIYEDPYGIEAWDKSRVSRCFVHIVNSSAFHSITCCRPPTEPFSTKDYTNAGIPWFDYWDDEAVALQGSKVLAQLDSVVSKKIKQGQKVDEPRVDVDDEAIVKLRHRRTEVRDGNF